LETVVASRFHTPVLCPPAFRGFLPPLLLYSV